MYQVVFTLLLARYVVQPCCEIYDCESNISGPQTPLTGMYSAFGACKKCETASRLLRKHHCGAQPAWLCDLGPCFSISSTASISSTMLL